MRPRMSEWALALVALALLGVAAVSRRLAGTPVTPAMLFVAFGLLVGPEVLDGIDLSSTGSAVRALAEATLALVLFCDASRIDLGQLRRAADVPVRLLGIGLPLTIVLGAVAAAVLFGELSVEEAVILAIVLAPTDAALGQAVVTEPRVPQRIRQGLNVESGLNDGICVPLLFAAVAAADVAVRDLRRPQPRRAAARGDRLRRAGRSGGRAGDRRDRHRGGPARSDRPRVEAGDPGCRRRARLRNRERAGRVRLHRGLRGRHRVPPGAPARPRGAQPAQRGGGRRPQRGHLRALRRHPARARAQRAELGARRCTPSSASRSCE